MTPCFLYNLRLWFLFFLLLKICHQWVSLCWLLTIYYQQTICHSPLLFAKLPRYISIVVPIMGSPWWYVDARFGLKILTHVGQHSQLLQSFHPCFLSSAIVDTSAKLKNIPSFTSILQFYAKSLLTLQKKCALLETL